MKIFRVNKKNVSDCVACLLYPLLMLGWIVGFTPLTISCPHISKKTSVANFQKFQPLVWINALLNILFLTLLIVYLSQIVWTSKDYSTMQNFKIVELLILLNGINCASVPLLKFNNKVVELNGLTLLIEARQYYGFSTILSPQITNAFLFKSYVIIIYVIVLCIINPVCAFKEAQKYGDIFMVTIFLVFNQLDIVVQCAFLYQSMLTSDLYKTLFHVCFSKIESTLKSHLKNRNKSNVEFPLSVRLKRLTSFYNNLVTNYHQLNYLYNPSILIWWTIIVAIMIINTYTLIVDYFEGYEMDNFMVFEVYGFTIAIIVYLVTSEQINYVSEDIMSFLFKYPISKLTTAEAAQVEMLITTLNLHRPILKASDIFVVGTRLLASISGTIVTYVLVALQFHAAWTKK